MNTKLYLTVAAIVAILYALALYATAISENGTWAARRIAASHVCETKRIASETIEYGLS